MRSIGYTRRHPAVLYRINGLDKNPPIGHDDFIRRAQVFACPVGNRPHAFYRPLVMHIDVFLAHAQVRSRHLLVRIKPPVVVAACFGNVVGQGDELLSLGAHGFFVQRAGKAGEEGVPVGVRVANWHMHLRDGHGLRQRNHKRCRKDGLRHAHMRQGVRHAPQCGELHAPGLVNKTDIWLGKLAHDARHGPLFTVYRACGSAAKLLARCIVANTFQRFVL